MSEWRRGDFVEEWGMSQVSGEGTISWVSDVIGEWGGAISWVSGDGIHG